MLIVSCSHGTHLGYSIAKKLNKKHAQLKVSKFPDDELLIRFDADPKGKIIVMVQSFYKNTSDCIIESILGARTARDLGAQKVILVAPYFPYLRQDKRFHKGESISQTIITGLFDKYFDSIYVLDPHLHRKNSLDQIFKIKNKKISSTELIAEYISQKIKNPVIIGPDSESYRWAKSVAESIGAEFRILTKKRFSSYHVEVKLNKKISLKGKNAVIVDDIVSTGHTIIEAAKLLRKIGAGNVYCICVHGIFADDALKKFGKNKIKIISTNTIPNKVANIDVSRLIAESLK